MGCPNYTILGFRPNQLNEMKCGCVVYIYFSCDMRSSGFILYKVAEVVQVT